MDSVAVVFTRFSQVCLAYLATNRRSLPALLTSARYPGRKSIIVARPSVDYTTIVLALRLVHQLSEAIDTITRLRVPFGAVSFCAADMAQSAPFYEPQTQSLTQGSVRGYVISVQTSLVRPFQTEHYQYITHPAISSSCSLFLNVFALRIGLPPLIP